MRVVLGVVWATGAHLHTMAVDHTGSATHVRRDDAAGSLEVTGAAAPAESEAEMTARFEEFASLLSAYGFGELQTKKLQPAELPQEPCEAEAEGVGAPDGAPTHCRPWKCSEGKKQWSMQQRIRKEIHDLSDKEFKLYSDTVNQLYQREEAADQDNSTHLYDHTTKPSMVNFVTLHCASHVGHSHDNFYPFHRRMLLDFETELQKQAQDCSVTIPYWNWAVESHKFDQSEAWRGKRFGKLPFEQECVEDGVAGGWRYVHGDGEDMCLMRGGHWNNWTTDHYRSTLPSWTALQGHAESSTYGEFRQKGELWHNKFHCMVHGDMCSMVAPRDPVFYSHHSFIDRFYDLWQEKHPAEHQECAGCTMLPNFGFAAATEYVGALHPTGPGTTVPVSDPSIWVQYAPETYRPDIKFEEEQARLNQTTPKLKYNCKCPSTNGNEWS